MKIVVFPLLMIVLWVSSSNAQQLHKSFTGIKKIRMSTTSGDCLLKKSNSSSVTVDLEHTFGEALSPEVEQNGDVLEIREIFRSGSSRGNSKWTITIPDGMDVRFSSGSGGIEVAQLSLDLKVNTGSGNFTLATVKGDVKGSSGSGNVSVDNYAGELNINSGSGEIAVRKSEGDMNLNGGSGNIRIADSKASFSANSGSGNVIGSNVTLTGGSKFNSGSGDAEILLAVAPSYNISVNSGSGDSQLDFNGAKIEGEVVMKANKKNGIIKAPFDFDKTEELNEHGDQVIVKKTAIKGNGNIKIAVSTGSGAAVLKN
ncbi:MAG: DUF4097 family beta strand repeat protein [Cyclobacteriaceae bacterium]|nr:DUF4097 family beta strand repeat protein [Cyclobacteriaceae bacterium]